MQFFDFRKYIFANLTAVWFYFFIYYRTAVSNLKFPPPSHNIFPSARGVVIGVGLMILLILFIFLCLTFVEILVRKVIKKFIIDKKFPDFKLKINIKIPKIVEIIYTIIFSIGFYLSLLFFIYVFVFNF